MKTKSMKTSLMMLMAALIIFAGCSKPAGSNTTETNTPAQVAAIPEQPVAAPAERKDAHEITAPMKPPGPAPETKRAKTAPHPETVVENAAPAPIPVAQAPPPEPVTPVAPASDPNPPVIPVPLPAAPAVRHVTIP